ncbi:hypothetical protein AXW67_38005 [Bradyrhizobium neotropicale]|nr:hypothetical protein AXW67_38005 [Bradyrhizobium neotropicale]
MLDHFPLPWNELQRLSHVQIGELQLELIQQRSALRGLPELLVPQLLDRELELLDQQCPRLGLRFRG